MSKSETQSVEFKSDWRDEHLKVVSAFANKSGGKLLVGVNDDGHPVGLKRAKKLMEDIPNTIINKLGITPKVNLKRINDDSDIIEIIVTPSTVPISFDGKFYIRSGSTVQELRGEELGRFIIRKMGKTWDALPSKLKPSEVDNGTVDYFKSSASGRIPGVNNKDTTNKILSNLELIADTGELTNAAVLLFASNPQKYYISAKTRIGRFKTPTDITDTVIAEGNLFNQLDKTFEAVKKHLNVKFEIKGVQREDIWDYPLEAIREAVLNAIIHKDYSSPAEIQIKIYDDRIWIWNPGELPDTLTIEDLKKEHSSYPKNPLIANAFYLAGFIERWGSGTKRIVDLCKESGLPEPEYTEEQGGFSVRFYRDIYNKQYYRQLGLNERQIYALDYLKHKGEITNREYRELLNVSDETARKDIVELIKKNILKKKGKGRSVHYTFKVSTASSTMHHHTAKKFNRNDN